MPSQNEAKKSLLILIFKFTLKHIFKLSAYHIFIALKILDVAWVCLVVPWLSANKASYRMKKREQSRRNIMLRAKNISHDNPHREFKSIVSAMWKERKLDKGKIR